MKKIITISPYKANNSLGDGNTKSMLHIKRVKLHYIVKQAYFKSIHFLYAS